MISWLFRRRREEELDEEIKTHLRMAVEERMARGESRPEAERAVRREFGNVGQVKEATRVVWGGMWLDRLIQELPFGPLSEVFASQLGAGGETKDVAGNDVAGKDVAEKDAAP